MPKITFMGAGSSVFAKNVLGDSMMTPALAESTIALYDIDADRLNDSKMMLDNLNKNCGNKAKIEAYLGVENRKAALKDANYVAVSYTHLDVYKRQGLNRQADAPLLLTRLQNRRIRLDGYLFPTLADQLIDRRHGIVAPPEIMGGFCILYTTSATLEEL